MLNSTRSTPVSAGYYSVIRILVGLYLTIHFLHLLPYGSELFSAQGLLPSTLSPLMNIIPNPLLHHDTPLVVSVLLMCGALSGVLIAAGQFDRVASLSAAILLAWLYARNPLIANPSLPVVGWMLIAHACLPSGAYGSWNSRNQPERWLQWFYPRQIWFSAWLLLAVAYTYSGYTKLLSPSWLDGSAIRLVLENPLARDHFLRTLLLDTPTLVLQLLTWTVMIIEVLFVLSCLLPATRLAAWVIMLAIQFGFLLFLNFADLTFPMLMIHALTFDRRWLKRFEPEQDATIFYDGQCGFCFGFVRFALAEDLDNKLKFAAQQGQYFRNLALPSPVDGDSIVVLDESGSVFFKSEAVIRCMETLGGIWLLTAYFLRIFPRAMRDHCYDFIGKIRYHLAPRINIDSCQLLPPAYRKRMYS